MSGSKPLSFETMWKLAVGSVAAARPTVGEGEVEGILTRGIQPDDLDRTRVLHQFLDQRHIQFLLPRAQQQGEVDGLGSDHREVDLVDVLMVQEHVVDRRREFCLMDRHQAVTGLLLISVSGANHKTFPRHQQPCPELPVQKNGSCGWFRTNDLVINSHPLYH